MRGICIVFVLPLSLSLDMVNGKGLMSILFALAIVQKITAFTAMNFSYPFVLVDVYNCFTRKGLLFFFFNYSIPNPAFLSL